METGLPGEMADSRMRAEKMCEVGLRQLNVKNYEENGVLPKEHRNWFEVPQWPNLEK